MTRLVTAVVAVTLGLPVLLAAAVVPAAPARGPVTVVAGGGDEAEVAAAPAALRPLFTAAARRYALPPALLTAVASVESGFRPDAVGVPIPGGPALGMMQFLPSSWALFNVVPGASPFQPGPAVLAAAHHLRVSGRLPDGGWDAARALYAYGGRSSDYVRLVLGRAAGYGYRYDPASPVWDTTRYAPPVTPFAAPGGSSAGAEVPLTVPAGGVVVACVRAEVLAAAGDARPGRGVVTLRGEDGWLYTYAGLLRLVAGLRAGTVVEAGTPLTPPLGAAVLVGFGIRRGERPGDDLDPAGFLTRWGSRAGR